MSYTQIELGGKSRGWKFNQEAFEIFLKKVNWMEPNPAGDTYACIYGGLIANCRVKNETVDFTFENVCDWVDELNATDAGQKVLTLVAKTFNESQVYLLALERMKKQIKTMKSEPETSKKKRPTI